MTSRDPLLLALDLGISTIKVALFTLSGERVGLERDEYLILPEGDKAEADPEVYWAPIAGAIRRLLKTWGGPPEQIAAVSVSSHTETVIPLDESGRPVRPAMVWIDKRSQPEAQELEKDFGLQQVLEISGQQEIAPIWPVTKLRWLSKHEPEATKRTAKFLMPADYLLYRLSGRFVADPTLWSSSVVLDITRREWSPELVSFAGIRESQLPELLPSGTTIGHISEACAEETGLSRSTAVVTGGLDQTCAAIGAGNIEPGVVTESTGTVLALLATIPKPILDSAARVPCHIHAVPDTYCLLPWNQAGGLALKWFKDRFARDVIEAAKASGGDVYDLLTAEADAVPAGSDGLILLPHLEGALFPEFDAAARGVFFGFTLNHGRAQFIRSILESVAFMLRRDLEGLQKLGVETRELRVLGGGAKSRVWCQIKADVSGLPVLVPNQEESASLGAAILAAVGTGLHKDIPSAVSAMVTAGKPISPTEHRRGVYDSAFHLYVKLYSALKDLFPLSGALTTRQPT